MTMHPEIDVSPLFEPLSVRGKSLRSRVVLPPMGADAQHHLCRWHLVVPGTRCRWRRPRHRRGNRCQPFRHGSGWIGRCQEVHHEHD